MSSRVRKTNPLSVSADPEIEAAEQGMYFLQEPGKQFREGQTVSYGWELMSKAAFTLSMCGLKLNPLCISQIND